MASEKDASIFPAPHGIVERQQVLDRPRLQLLRHPLPISTPRNAYSALENWKPPRIDRTFAALTAGVTCHRPLATDADSFARTYKAFL